MKPFRVLKLSLQDMERTWKGVTWTLGAIILEAYARFLGSYDFYIKKRNPYVWDIAASTKDLSLGDDRNTATDSPV
jgi:fructose-1,6-bisphosphatase/inositol monophosphatase family enzyme